MIQRAEQANIVGLRSKDFVKWVEENMVPYYPLGEFVDR